MRKTTVNRDTFDWTGVLFKENNLKEESDKLLADYISQCNDIINELPVEIQGGLNELISYIIKRNK